MDYLTIKPGKTIRLSGPEGRCGPAHVFGSEDIDAINAVLAAERPLLVRGEPGIGKSQLARAVAKCLRRMYVPFVVDARTESQDMLWHYDAVARLADAQLGGALGERQQAKVLRRTLKLARQRLPVRAYLHPRALWWAFDWEDAELQAAAVGDSAPSQVDYDASVNERPSHQNGCVVLIDEIDKAESDVPNGLLEALGAHEFTPFGRVEPVRAGKTPPLVIITTNNERALPDAFLRRCLVLQLNFPKDDEGRKRFLMGRGRAHFPEADDDILQEAAHQLVKDRKACERERHFPLPGQAEYLDLLRAVLRQRPGDPDAQRKLLERIAVFTFKKYPGAK